MILPVSASRRSPRNRVGVSVGTWRGYFALGDLRFSHEISLRSSQLGGPFWQRACGTQPKWCFLRFFCKIFGFCEKKPSFIYHAEIWVVHIHQLASPESLAVNASKNFVCFTNVIVHNRLRSKLVTTTFRTFFTCFFGPARVSISYVFMLRRGFFLQRRKSVCLCV